ncbi:MAG TPA: thiolase family protein [Hypericibacter adhaerens]|jgi:acetyl-CoA acyltransferase|uniref:Acetyl-CoA acetyltransferase n=1 Tax=Hypericibacter adhaerens TaxID=2602016 RepID=A0A5J6N4S0_9PROT|nr:thiolase family protein [Hypericibacter adhaerens]QEX24831.1 acetyl-CoA acetyltransferase [Hypericibacter adhaerens]HWA42760.1 thiolase family protein [Hypericibacter adhaerens]
MTRSAVIVGYARTPFHFAHKGALAKVRPDDLAATAVKAVLERTGVPAGEVEDLQMGCAFPEGEQGFNIARLVVLLAGLPQSVAGATINRFCGSSMQGIHNAAGAIALGAGDVFICAGVESMSRVPMMGFNPMPHPGLAEKVPGAYMAMGITAENLVRKYKIGRDRQDAFSLSSQQKAAAAQAAGKLDKEIAPVGAGNDIVAKDGCIRPESTIEGLKGLKPAFEADGSVTAGSSSPLTDGASAVLLTSEEYAKAHGLKPLARIKSISVAGCAPEIMGIGPVAATKKALDRAKLKVGDLDVIELNEAFAVQALACADDLKLDLNKTNLDGGAIALGHPLGATGARITGKAAQLLAREGKKFALATQCIGGGQGIATILEAV